MTTTLTNAPFRADNVGSFLRPASLKNARALHKAGVLDDAALKVVEDEAIKDLIHKQVAHGLKGITDGEFRRSWWHLDFFWGLQGFKKAARLQGYKFVGIETRAETAVIEGSIGGNNHPFVEHFKFVKQFENLAPGLVARQTVPAPAHIITLLQNVLHSEPEQNWKEYYSSTEDLIVAIGKAYQQVFKDLYDAGCRNIQIDDCTWPTLCNPERIKEFGIDPKALGEALLAANNAAIENKPEDLVITSHICRGNYRSHYAGKGAYDAVAPFLFPGEHVSGWYLEYDDERSGGFECLAHVPSDKKVVLGIITSKHPELENLDALKKRVEEASKYVPLDNLCVSPQCGFASTEEGNELTEEQQWAKIDLTVKLAKEIWG